LLRVKLLKTRGLWTPNLLLLDLLLLQENSSDGGSYKRRQCTCIKYMEWIQ
jgi:hypothetical protein